MFILKNFGSPLSFWHNLKKKSVFSGEIATSELTACKFQKPKHCKGFSLVEMLMALLVASLLLAALAPVMTRKVTNENINITTEMANYEKNLVISVFSKDTDFNIPIDANQVRVTMMGGGGKGGDALYGNKTITSNESFTVPKDVTKLRVFMVGGGGGGASGGMGNTAAYANVPAIGNTYTTFTTAGNYTFKDVTAPDSHKAPALPSSCSQYGTTKKWVVVSDTATEVAPGAKISKVDESAMVTLSKVTACGGGGGAGENGGGGGSGGYIADKSISSTLTANNVSIKIGAGGQSGHYGGAGGAGGGTGGAEGGATGYLKGGTGTNGNGGKGVGNSGGGGGGTSISIISTGYMLAQIGGGGGGGGHCWKMKDNFGGTTFIEDQNICYTGGGGGGGGYGSGGGGGSGLWAGNETWGCAARNGTNGGNNGSGGRCGFATDDTSYYSQRGGAGYGGGGGGGGGAWNDNKYGAGITTCGRTSSNGNSTNNAGGGGAGWVQNYYPNNAYTFGGGGGGGAGGIGGYGGGINGMVGGKLTSSIFSNATNCSGGEGDNANNGYNGKPGAMRIWYSVAAVANGLKCTYYRPSNGGGGGGAGQIWIGEIKVTPGQTINFSIGQGGAVQSAGAENGFDGTATSIVVGGNTYSVSGGKGGKYESDSTYIANSGGLGGGIKNTNFNSNAVYKDWLKLGEKVSKLTGGNGGLQGYTISSSEKGKGGNGGSSLNINGYLDGGNGGISAQNGANASSVSYGAGGGGGAAGTDGTFGSGGRGANGYIYIEWGGTNGGGGTVGEIVQTVITNLEGDPSKRTMKIRIGRGGGISGMASDDDSSLFTSSTIGSDGNGGETSISVTSGGKTLTHKARGGLKGNNGSMEAGINGELKEYPDNYSKLYKEYIQTNISTIIASGQEANSEYGGMGGYLSCLLKTKDTEGKTLCSSTAKANDGTNTTLGPIRPGCGGTSILSPLYETICNITNASASPNGNNGVFGGGGGGGAVLNKAGGVGGNGGNGFVILEYKSTTLD